MFSFVTQPSLARPPFSFKGLCDMTTSRQGHRKGVWLPAAPCELCFLVSFCDFPRSTVFGGMGGGGGTKGANRLLCMYKYKYNIAVI